MNSPNNNSTCSCISSNIENCNLSIQRTPITSGNEIFEPYAYETFVHRISILIRSTIFEAGKRLRLPQCPIIENSLVVWERYRECTWGRNYRQFKKENDSSNFETSHILTREEVTILTNNAEQSAQASILLACKNNNLEIDLNLIVFQFAYLRERPWIILGQHHTYPWPEPSYPPYIPDQALLKQNILDLEMEILFKTSFQISNISIYGLLAKIILDLKRGGALKQVNSLDNEQLGTHSVKSLTNLSQVTWTTVLTYNSAIINTHQPLTICLSILCICVEKLGLSLQWNFNTEDHQSGGSSDNKWWLKYSTDEPRLLDAKNNITEILRKSSKYKENSLAI
ncbi:hypothetical protein NADFUDRAFT_53117 [Nadsonia fulvescens var. elongata DSM 6958]|uniref:Uncharacterized protein n=1 Tax=Nadsonia fulvescens var. elongata DSM 6958 TaxID=857566 RepID=A0A1E3PDG2_9ASCO|nr:hypothetical protein NADFUDRAFT_53117 [Nadsonia fulvescens var. elongata DSM 6958]